MYFSQIKMLNNTIAWSCYSIIAVEYCLFKERCQSHSIPIVLASVDVHSQTSLAVIERIQASIECQCSYCLEQRGAQVVLIITSLYIEFHLFYTDGKRRS